MRMTRDKTRSVAEHLDGVIVRRARYSFPES
jgi:hypothetical protein